MMLNIFYWILAYRNKADHWIPRFNILIKNITISLLQLFLEICFSWPQEADCIEKSMSKLENEQSHKQLHWHSSLDARQKEKLSMSS